MNEREAAEDFDRWWNEPPRYEALEQRTLPQSWFVPRERIPNVTTKPRKDPIMELSISYNDPPNFGDEEQAEAYRKAVEELRGRTPFKFTLAPGCQACGKRGGEEITLTNVKGSREAMSELIRRGIVVEIGDDEVEARKQPTGNRTRYRIGKDCLLGVRPLLPGEWVCAEDFRGSPAEAEIPAVPAHVNDLGVPVAARPAIPARHAITCEQVLEELVARGRVIDTAAQQRLRAV